MRDFHWGQGCELFCEIHQAILRVVRRPRIHQARTLGLLSGGCESAWGRCTIPYLVSCVALGCTMEMHHAIFRVRRLRIHQVGTLGFPEGPGMRIVLGDHDAILGVVRHLRIYHATTLWFSVGARDANRPGRYTTPYLYGRASPQDTPRQDIMVFCGGPGCESPG